MGGIPSILLCGDKPDTLPPNPHTPPYNSDAQLTRLRIYQRRCRDDCTVIALNVVSSIDREKKITAGKLQSYSHPATTFKFASALSPCSHQFAHSLMIQLQLKEPIVTAGKLYSTFAAGKSW